MTATSLILDSPECQKSEVYFVSVYEVASVYGGREEGGWWHTYYKCVGSVKFFSLADAEAYLESAEKKAEELQSSANARFGEYYESRFGNSVEIEDDFCRGETAGADNYRVYIEEVRGSMDNSSEPIPRWE